MKKLFKPLILLSLVWLLQGCAAGLLLGGGAAAVATIHDRRSAGQVIDDQAMEVKIGKDLYANKYIADYSHTNLTIFNGVVLVTGEASNQQVIDAIIKTIQSTKGVKRIESDIVVAPTSSMLSRGTDSAITGKVKTALLSLNLPNFDPSLINVSTERGNVYLMGIVSRAEGQAIADKASRVNGVRSVVKVFEYTD